MKISVISGGFDPIHSGHIEYIKSASLIGHKLIVLLNSDEWLKDKKGSAFMPFEERKTIIESLQYVDEVIDFEDDEIGSCKQGLYKIIDKYPKDEIIFCNGGDRDNKNIPEMEVNDISFKFSIGGNDKKNSSSWILKNWSYPKEERVWGKFYDLFQDQNVKVKELIVLPDKGMSFQRHAKRNEIWLVSKGACKIKHSTSTPEKAIEKELGKHDWCIINQHEWHQIINPYDVTCHIIEIQYGQETSESDIERLFYHDS